MLTDLDKQIFSETFKLYADFKDRCGRTPDTSPEYEKAWSELGTAYWQACDRCHMHPVAIE